MKKTTMKITRKQAAPFLAETFPQYNGRKITVVFTDKVTFHDTNWGDGSRNVYKALDMATSKSNKLTVNAPWVNPVEGATVELPAGKLIVEHSIFCGQDVGITIYSNPCHIPNPAFLPAGNLALKA